MVIDNKTLTNRLCSDISNRFLLSKLPQYEDGELIILQERRYMLLKCADSRETEFLKNNRYAELIANILMYTELPENLLDMASKIYKKSDIEHIWECFGTAQEKLCYFWNEEGLVFEAPEFFIDLFVEIISRFHNQVTSSFQDFQRAQDEMPDAGRFLEALTPGFHSQYAQYWVAEKFDMFNFPKRIVVV